MLTLDTIIEYAKEAKTLGERSYYLSIIEARMAKDCPFTGYAFLKSHEPALQWYFNQGVMSES